MFEKVDTHKYNHLVIIIREFTWDNCFQIMFVILLTSFYHLKAKFNKTIIVSIMGAITH